MKFHQLRPGARFRLHGGIYRKISPLKATNEADDSQRLVPRSTEVTPLDASDQPAVTELPETLSRASVEAALHDLTTACLRAVECSDPPPSASQRAQLEQAFAHARSDILVRLAMRH